MFLMVHTQWGLSPNQTTVMSEEVTRPEDKLAHFSTPLVKAKRCLHPTLNPSCGFAAASFRFEVGKSDSHVLLMDTLVCRFFFLSLFPLHFQDRETASGRRAILDFLSFITNFWFRYQTA